MTSNVSSEPVFYSLNFGRSNRSVSYLEEEDYVNENYSTSVAFYAASGDGINAESILPCVRHIHPASAVMMRLFAQAVAAGDLNEAEEHILALEACSNHIYSDFEVFTRGAKESPIAQAWASTRDKHVKDDCDLKKSLLDLYYQALMRRSVPETAVQVVEEAEPVAQLAQVDSLDFDGTS